MWYNMSNYINKVQKEILEISKGNCSTWIRNKVDGGTRKPQKAFKVKKESPTMTGKSVEINFERETSKETIE